MPELTTPELKAMKAYLDSTGVKYRITSTTTGNHVVNSWHFKGLAMDLAEPLPSRDTPGLLAIFNVWVRFEKQLHELIYAGASFNIKNGQRVARYSVTNHHDHVHVAVMTGFRWQPAPPPVRLEVRPMWDPPLQVVDFLPYWAGSGGYMLFADGGVGAVGDAPYREGKQPLGNDYWVGRKPARMERLGEHGYTVVATSGERYDYP